MSAEKNAMCSRPILTRVSPPSRRDKFLRGIWQTCYVFLFRITPIPCHAWRRCILRVFGARVGRKAGIYPSARIWAPWNVKIADGATVGGGANLYSVGEISIGCGAVISQGAHLCAASHDHNSERFELTVGSIEISANAWVGADAFIGPGVALAEGAVAAARSVVVRSVQERMIVAGNPARVVSERSCYGRNCLAGRSG